MLVVREWLKEYVGEKIPHVEELEQLLSLHAFEIEGTEAKGTHEVIDVDVLPNRSSDCLSHRGIAREIATLIDTKLEHDPLAEEAELQPKAEGIAVQIGDANACRRFTAAVITGIKITESPDWLQERLAAIGQRPINNVVDATNYVMFALGQPLHAYDADKLSNEKGGYHIGVRMARDGEEITTLTGEQYTFDPSIQLIVDAATDIPIGVAGIKGGAHAEIGEKTTSVVLEAANFDPTITRKAVQTLKLATDASKRFENDIAPDVTAYGLKEAVTLITELAEGTCIGYIDEYPTKKSNSTVRVTLPHINALLGLSLTKETVESIFTRLGFSFSVVEDGWDITAPFERTDINIAEDVIEEVGRVYGYEHIVSVPPEKIPLTEINQRHYYSEKIRHVLQDIGFSEVITSSFRKKDAVKLLNALASDKQYLRSSLQKNIAEVLDKNMPNADLLGLDSIRMFEIGSVFYKKEGEKGVAEHISVALGVRTKQTGYIPKDDEVVGNAIKMLEKALGVSVNTTLGKGLAEFNLTELLQQLPEQKAYESHNISEELQYEPFSQYPFISRDVALWVPDDTEVKDVEDTIAKAAGELCVRMRLFDEFKKDGRVSYAFRLVFQSYKKTLKDSEIEPLMEAVYTAIKRQKWEVR
jgi:phenylalanyl-tRNA synthetase beta chain